MNKKLALTSFLAVILSLYPLLVYFGLNNYGPRLIAGLLIIAAAARFFLSKSSGAARISNSLWITLAALAAAGITLVTGSVLGLKFYPVLINLSFLFLFAYSLWNKPTAVERFARLTDPNLDEDGVIYTRKVTIVWCLFFIANGTIALVTVFASDEIWALYNGLISYILMACLFGIEYAVRLVTLRKKGR